MTLEEAMKLKYRVTVDNVNFDVPVLYHYTDYLRHGGWARPPEDEINGTGRRKVDVIKITALLPNMDAYNEINAAEFDKPGWGKTVKAYMTYRRVDWNYYFNGAFKRLIRLPDSSVVPDMLRYRDAMSNNREVYLSHEKPVDKLIRIFCDDPKNDPKPPPSPSCTVKTVYRDQFDLDITFGLEYLSNWREIDQKMQALLDSFVVSDNVSINKKGE